MSEEHPTESTQPSESNVSSEGGEEAVSQAPSDAQDGNNLTLAELNELLGKNFKDKATALKSLKDMSSQAGKSADLEGRVKEFDALKQSVDEIKLDAWFARNPEHEANREILEALAHKHDTTIQEAVELEAYQELNKRAPKSEKRTSVMDSKKRQQSSDDRDKALEEAKKSGNFGAFLAKYHATPSNQ